MKNIPRHVVLYTINHLAVLTAIVTANYWTILYGYLLWVICGLLGLSVCIHRSVTHRGITFKSIWLKNICLTTAVPVINTSPIEWAYAHRGHHAYLDTDLDPHSPKKIGFWRSYFHLWHYNPKSSSISVKDLVIDRQVLWFHKHWIKVLASMWLLSWLVFGLQGLLTVMIIGFWACHAFGVTNANFHHTKEPGEVQDGPMLTWLCGGENHHAYHHQMASDHRFSRSRWDPSAETAEFFYRRGWVDLRHPPEPQ